ncbi:MAG: class I SAM-dependent methyltransferase, partial [Thermoleophilaceae bacterium]
MDEPLYDRLRELEDDHWWFRGRRAVIQALVTHAGPLPGSARVLDAGCGTGRNLHEYARLGQAEGIEPSQTAVDYCRERGLAVQQAGLESLPFA